MGDAAPRPAMSIHLLGCNLFCGEVRGEGAVSGQARAKMEALVVTVLMHGK